MSASGAFDEGPETLSPAAAERAMRSGTLRGCDLGRPLLRSVTRQAVVKRALSWVTAEMPYDQKSTACGVKYRQSSGGAATSTFSPSNTEFFAYGNYRRDCSGLVSMAGGIGSPAGNSAYTTGGLAAGADGKLRDIMRADAGPGDVLVRGGKHTAIIQSRAGSGFNVIEEPTWGKHATQSFWSGQKANTYKAMRFTHLVDAPPTTYVQEGNQAFEYGDQQHAVNIDSDGSLQHTFLDAETSQVARNVDNWGGGLQGNPVAIVALGQQHVFARSADNKLVHRFWDPKDARVNEENLSHTTASGDPEAAVIDEQQHVWWVDAGGTLRHRWFGGGFWSENVWAQGIKGKPNFYWVNGQQHVVVRGVNDNLYNIWWEPNGNKIVSMPLVTDGQVAADPEATMVGEQQHIWYTTKSGELKHLFMSPGDRGFHHQTWRGAGEVTGRPVFVEHMGQQHVYNKGPQGNIVETYWDYRHGIVKQAWGDMDIAGDPFAANLWNQQHVFYRVADRKLRHVFWSPEAQGNGFWE